MEQDVRDASRVRWVSLGVGVLFAFLVVQYAVPMAFAATPHNIRDYGAVGNGIANDTAAIQAAVDAASAEGGGTVFIPAGTYLVSTPDAWPIAIHLKSNVTIEGEGPASVVKLKPGSPVTRMFQTAPGGSGTKNVTIRNFKMDGSVSDGNHDNQEHSHGIFVSDGGWGNGDDPADNVRIENMEITNMQGDGIFFFQTVTNSLVANNWIHDNYRIGINLEVAQNTVVSHNLIENCKSCIHIEMDNEGTVNTGNVIRDNTIRNGGHSVVLNGHNGTLTDVTVTGNDFTGVTDPTRIGDGTSNTNQGTAVILEQANNAVVTNNTIRGMSYAKAIWIMHGNNNVLVEGNSLTGNLNTSAVDAFPSAIRIGSSTDTRQNRNITVRGNSINDYRGGIDVLMNSGTRPANITIEGNTLSLIRLGRAILAWDVEGTLTIKNNYVTHTENWGNTTGFKDYSIVVDDIGGGGGTDNAIINGNVTHQDSGRAHIGIFAVKNLTITNNHAYGDLQTISNGEQNVTGTLTNHSNTWQSGNPPPTTTTTTTPPPPTTTTTTTTPPTTTTTPPPVEEYQGPPPPAPITLAGDPSFNSFNESQAVVFVNLTTAEWHIVDGAGNVNSFYFGVPGDQPIYGDWNCDGVQTPGMFRPSTGYLYLRDSNNIGFADRDFFFGVGNDTPLAGDWNGDGCDTVGVYRSTHGQVFLLNSLGTAVADVSYSFGDPGDRPFVGDFNGDDRDEVALHGPGGQVKIQFRPSPSSSDTTFYYGVSGDVAAAGDWDADGVDTVAVFRPSTSTMLASNKNSTGVSAVSFHLWSGTLTPVT